MKQLPFEHYLSDFEANFSGWDFGYLTETSRMQEFPLPWNYYNVLEPYLREANSLLDMGTGGGEFLSRLQPLPPITCATEGYEPNVAVATRNLAPFGVTVVRVEDDFRLPFEPASFQLVLNRHESYDPAEIKRVLAPGGRFVTQQVGGLNDCEFNEALGAPPSEYADWNLKSAAPALQEAGLNVIYSNESVTRTRFYDLGAVLYYLKIIEWQIPNFTIDGYRDRLENIYRRIRNDGYFDVTCHRFIVMARKDEDRER